MSPFSKDRPKNLKEWKNFLREDVTVDIILEIQLIGLAFAAGINDATTFPDYSLFVSNQTGNTALLAVGALGIGGERLYLPNIGFSLVTFIIGGILFGQIGDRVGRHKRWWLIVTNAVQAALVLTSAALRQWYTSSSLGHRAWSIIALLAFASGGQVAMARTINVPEITTAMVTSAYIDFVVDPAIFDWKNRSRNRRFFFVLSLLTGSFIGASAYKYVGPALGLLLAGICKACICFAFFLNRAPPPLEHGQDAETVEHGQHDPTHRQ